MSFSYTHLLADVFADDAQTHQLDAAHEADDADGGGPARHGAAQNSLHDGPDDTDEADEADRDACAGDEADGLDVYKRQLRSAKLWTVLPFSTT